MLMSAPIVVYGQWWNDVGSGENEISKGRAVCARAGDRAPATSLAMILCARFLLPRSQQKAWSP